MLTQIHIRIVLWRIFENIGEKTLTRSNYSIIREKIETYRTYASFVGNSN